MPKSKDGELPIGIHETVSFMEECLDFIGLGPRSAGCKREKQSDSDEDDDE
jgi:hypothetical protein